jgi:hypothetical protein
MAKRRSHTRRRRSIIRRLPIPPISQVGTWVNEPPDSPRTYYRRRLGRRDSSPTHRFLSDLENPEEYSVDAEPIVMRNPLFNIGAPRYLEYRNRPVYKPKYQDRRDFELGA